MGGGEIPMTKTKKFIYDENKPPITYRPGTSDDAIIKSVMVDRGEYLFPVFEPKIVFDIGANIGVVSTVLANVYPRAKIYSFEPEADNLALLKENMAPYPNVTILDYGLGARTEEVPLYKSDNPLNKGGFSTHIQTPGDCSIIKVVDVKTIYDTYGIPDLIKIDVEGAEYDILKNMPGLHCVKWISGELHGIKDYALLDHLSKHFKIHCNRTFDDKCWHFHAVSKSWTENLKPR